MSNLFKTHDLSEAGSVCIFKQRST